MENESKNEEEQTSDQPDSVDEKKDETQTVETETKEVAEDTTQKTDETQEEVEQEPVEPEWTPPSQEEFEKVSKKAQDFENSIELKRLAKLKAKEADAPEGEDTSELRKEIDELKTQVQGIGQANQDSVMKDAYKEFVGQNAWADNDAMFSKISETFTGDENDATSKEDVLAKLKKAAMNTYPSEYEKGIADKAKSEALADNSTIDAGDLSGGSSNANQYKQGDKTLTPRQLEIARMSGNDVKEVYQEEK